VGAMLRSLVASSLQGGHTHKRQNGGEGEDDGDGDRTVDGVEIEGRIAQDLVEERKELKEELGVECLVIGKIRRFLVGRQQPRLRRQRRKIKPRRGAGASLTSTIPTSTVRLMVLLPHHQHQAPDTKISQHH
jgi:hypothetical protein